MRFKFKTCFKNKYNHSISRHLTNFSHVIFSGFLQFVPNVRRRRYPHWSTARAATRSGTLTPMWLHSTMAAFEFLFKKYVCIVSYLIRILGQFYLYWFLKFHLDVSSLIVTTSAFVKKKNSNMRYLKNSWNQWKSIGPAYVSQILIVTTSTFVEKEMSKMRHLKKFVKHRGNGGFYSGEQNTYTQETQLNLTSAVS